jgi:hypothetical protein
MYSWLEVPVNVYRNNTNRAIPTWPLRAGCVEENSSLAGGGRDRQE